jgi:hypothetical protein
MKTAYDLLMTAPDEQVTRMRLAWQAIADGDWVEAENKLRNVSLETDGPYSADCMELALHCRAQASEASQS